MRSYYSGDTSYFRNEMNGVYKIYISAWANSASIHTVFASCVYVGSIHAYGLYNFLQGMESFDKWL